MKILIKIVEQIWFAIRLDMKFVRTRFFMFLYNNIPNLFILKIIKVIFLKFAGVKTGFNDCYVKSPVYIDYAPNIKIGKGVFINIGTHIEGNASVIIGDHCQIGPFCKLETTNHVGDMVQHLPIEVGCNVWLGAAVIITPGVKIGNGAIIAAGAVVIKNVPSNELWGGIPARKIKTIEAEV